MKVRFTKATIQAIAPPETGRIDVHDSEQRNLILRISASGKKAFYFYGKLNRRPRRLALGEFPDMTIAQARERCRDLPAEMRINEPSVTQSRRGAVTFGQLWEHWLEHHAKKVKRTFAEDERNYKNSLAKWASRRASDIRQTEVSKLHGDIGRNQGHYAANRVLALTRTIFNHGIKSQDIAFNGPNPAVGVRKFDEDERERFLLPDELPRFFTALEAAGEPWRDFYRLLLFTGVRRGNLAAMRWDELNLESGLWNVPTYLLKCQHCI